MNKATRLGIHENVVAAMVYLIALAGGYTPLFLLAGYILLCENSEALKLHAIKANVIMFATAALGYIGGLLPEAIKCLDALVGIFGGEFFIGFAYNIGTAANSAAYFIRYVLLIALGLSAFVGNKFTVKPLDDLTAKCTDMAEAHIPAAQNFTAPVAPATHNPVERSAQPAPQAAPAEPAFYEQPTQPAQSAEPTAPVNNAPVSGRII